MSAASIPATTASARAPQRARWATPAARGWALFLAFLGFYLLTGSGHLYAVDEETLYRITESVVERRTLALPDDAWGMVLSEQPTDGRRYAQYEPGQGFAAVPLYLLGRAVSPLFPPDAHAYVVRFFVGLLGAFVTAATVALLYRLVGLLGYGERVALGLAAIYGVATLAWPFARTFFAEPLTALLLLLSFYYAARGTRRSDADGDADPASRPDPAPRLAGRLPRLSGTLLLSGVAAGLALLVKPHGALALPCIGLYLLGRSLVGEGWAARARHASGPVAAWWAGFAVAVLPLLWVNAAIYGGPLTTGYSAGRLDGLAYPWLTGLYGMVLSSGKGFFWYSPPVVLALLGARAFYRRHRAEALACLGIVAIHLAFYCRLSLWNGDWAWGLRYLLIMLPFTLLPAAAFLAEVRGRWPRRGVVALVVALGIGVQLLGVLVNFVGDRARIYDEPTTAAERNARIDARYFSPPSSPLAVHARTLIRNLGEWRARVDPPPDTAVLTGGFAAPEIDPARATFPRWTTGAGTVTLHPAAREPLTVKFTFFDHRPPARRAERPTILVNGVALPDDAVERRDFSGDGTGWVYQLIIPAEAIDGGRATVTLASPTWNPRAAGQSDRDEDLGVYVNSVEVWRAGEPWRVRDRPGLLVTRTFGAVPADPEALYGWFNGDRAFSGPGFVDPAHHLVDHWAWYAAVAGLGRGTATAWIATYGLIAALPLVLGLWLLARSSPPGQVPARRRRPARRRARRRGMLAGQ